MGLFKRKQQMHGLTAVGVYPQGVAVVRIGRQGDDPLPTVDLWAFRALRPGENVARVLGELALEHGLEHTRCISVLSEQDYKLVMAEAPDVPKEELREALRWQVKGMVDFPVMDAAIDVFEFPKPDGPVDAHRVYVVAAKREAIERQVELFGDAGIDLRLITIPELAERNLLTLLPDTGTPMALVSCHQGKILITLYYDGDIYLCRRINVALDIQQGESALTGYYSEITLEVQRSIKYFETRYYHCPPLHQVVLAPSPFVTSGLAEHLGSSLDVSVLEMKLSQLLNWSSKAAEHGLTEELSTTAFGAALYLDEVGA